MSIKIFLPTNYFYLKQSCDLYGQVQISEDNVVTYYVVDNSSCLDYRTTCTMRYLGSIVCSSDSTHQHQDMIICFAYNNKSPNITLTYVGITPESLEQIKLVLYDKCLIRNLSVKSPTSAQSSSLDNECDFLTLFRLIQQPDDTLSKSGPYYNQRYIANIPTQMFGYIVENRFINKIMMHTVIYKHYKEWKEIYAEGSRFANIIVDRILGIALMLVLFMLVSHAGDFLIQFSHGIISQLYRLLKVLEGSPIGLKLNTHLNNFFLDCFKYHIELWSTFLDLIEPAVRQLFVIIGVLGCLGFSYQIALLADLISIVGLHAHCFYVYTKVLYNVELKGLKVLWQVVRGKRFNVLRGRNEAHDYMNRQLYLATIFFTAILFLFPTTLVYYSVFATLKSFTIATFTVLGVFRRQLLTFPLTVYLKWMNKSFFQIECLKLRDLLNPQQTYLKHVNFEICVSVFEVRS